MFPYHMNRKELYFSKYLYEIKVVEHGPAILRVEMWLIVFLTANTGAIGLILIANYKSRQVGTWGP